MTDNIDDNQSQPEPEEPKAEEQPTPSATMDDAAEAIQAFKQKATEAFKSGTEDARESFEKTFPQTKDDIAKGINDASYAIGYAVSFGTTLIKEFSPDNVTDGFDRGTNAGSKAAEEVIEHRKAKPVDVPDDPDPATS